jgi:hypothetical protein
MAKTISGEVEALFIGLDGEEVGLQAVRVNMQHSSKPLNRRYIKSMRGILQIMLLHGELAFKAENFNNCIHPTHNIGY